MGLLEKLKSRILRFLGFECSHSAAKNNSCKYCPDCGQKIITKWVAVKCKQCNFYRKPYLDFFNKVKPISKYCCFCGSDNWSYHYYYETNISEKLKHIAIRVTSTEPLNIYKFGDRTQNVNVWVEPPAKSGLKGSINFLKFE